MWPWLTPKTACSSSTNNTTHSFSFLKHFCLKEVCYKLWWRPSKLFLLISKTLRVFKAFPLTIHSDQRRFALSFKTPVATESPELVKERSLTRIVQCTCCIIHCLKCAQRIIHLCWCVQKDLRLRRKISQIVFKSSRIRKHYSIKDRRKQKVDVEVVFAHRQTFSEALIFSSPNYFPITYLSGKLEEKYTHTVSAKKPWV